MTVQKHIPEDYMPLLSIMFKPRDAFNYVLQHKKLSYVLYIGALGGFASSLAILYGSKYPYGYSLGQIVTSSFITGIFMVMLTNLVMALLLKWTGAPLKGQGTFKSLFQVMCLVTIPYIWLLPVVLFWMQLVPETFFKMRGLVTLGEAIWGYTGAFFILAAAIWTIVLSIVGISEAHSFSKWKALICFLIATVVSLLILGSLRLFAL